MRVLTDENVHQEIVSILKKSHDVKTASSFGLAGQDDDRILEKAHGDKRVLITGDKDFGGLMEFRPLTQPGKVILLRYHLIRPAYIASEVLEVLKSEEKLLNSEEDAILVLSEGRCRIRSFKTSE